jgi:hypothetical protein
MKAIIYTTIVACFLYIAGILIHPAILLNSASAEQASPNLMPSDQLPHITLSADVDISAGILHYGAKWDGPVELMFVISAAPGPSPDQYLESGSVAPGMPGGVMVSSPIAIQKKLMGGDTTKTEIGFRIALYARKVHSDSCYTLLDTKFVDCRSRPATMPVGEGKK